MEPLMACFMAVTSLLSTWNTTLCSRGFDCIAKAGVIAEAHLSVAMIAKANNAGANVDGEGLIRLRLFT